VVVETVAVVVETVAVVVETVAVETDRRARRLRTFQCTSG